MVSTENEKKMRELGILTLKRMHVCGDTVPQFEKGTVYTSEGHLSTLFTPNKKDMETIQMIEAGGLRLVWHVIKGTYILGGCDKVQMNAYLYIDIEDVAGDSPLEQCEMMEMLQDGICRAYVDNTTWGEHNWGDVGIRPHFGGISRTA